MKLFDLMIRFHVQHLFMPRARANGLVYCLLKWYTFQLNSGTLLNR
jgi:hypothetical protein